MKFSVIIPTLNDAPALDKSLAALQRLLGADDEVIVTDGGSEDALEAVLANRGAQLARSAPGRGVQMSNGAAVASGEVLLFLHADTQLPEAAFPLIERALQDKSYWGRFDVRLSGNKSMFRVIEWLINRRSRLTGIASGDQAIFVRRDAFEAVGGYPPIPLMEDLALSHALRRRYGRPACIRVPVITSSRRWEQHGTWRTILLMWRLRLSYYLGTSPERLAQRYNRG